MTFQDSIKTGFQKYAEFRGRATKTEFWWWVLFIFLGSLVLSFISNSASAVFSLVTLLPSIAVTTRRLHDTDRSGWFQLVSLIPLIGWILMIYWCIQEPKEPNHYSA
ncbi:MAG: Integral rane protein [Rhizobacter sp.]|nr:Integral rane protein [Rhizobacter sp.]